MMTSQDGSLWMGGGFMWFVWLLLIIAAAWLIKFISAHNKDDTSSPLTLLEQRYARGEINEQEYQHMKHQLQTRGNLR